MNVSKIWWGYRKIGPSYGLPVIYVKSGYSNYEPEDVILEMKKIGLNLRNLVVLTGFGTSEKGLVTLIEFLKTARIVVEFECSGNEKMPTWFTRPDRWFVEWLPGGLFNYTGLRNKQDMVMYSGADINAFLIATEKTGALRGLVVDRPSDIFEKVKGTGVRVYAR